MFMSVAGLIAGALTSNRVHITDQYWGNVGILAAGGTVVALLLDFFFVSPIRLWRRAEKQLAQQNEKSPAPLATHTGSGHQFIILPPDVGYAQDLIASITATGQLPTHNYGQISTTAQSATASGELLHLPWSPARARLVSPDLRKRQPRDARPRGPSHD
jgi:hypothetical protein